MMKQVLCRVLYSCCGASFMNSYNFSGNFERNIHLVKHLSTKLHLSTAKWTSSHYNLQNQNLCTDLQKVVKQTCKSAHKLIQDAKCCINFTHFIGLCICVMTADF